MTFSINKYKVTQEKLLLKLFITLYIIMYVYNEITSQI